MKIIVCLLYLFAISAYTYANCSDGLFYCKNSGTTITYGRKYKFPFWCKPILDYKQICKDIGDNEDDMYKLWMENYQNRSLMQLTIPGAHNAGMGKISTCSDYATSGITKTQNKSFSKMLNTGVRYFDVRPVIKKNGDLYLGHFSWVGKSQKVLVHTFKLMNEGCYGYSVDEMLNDISKFISNSAGEIIILNFSHYMNFKTHDTSSSHFDKSDFIHLKNKIIHKLGPYLIKNYTNKKLLTTKLSLLTRGKSRVIIFFEAANDMPQRFANSAEGFYLKPGNIYDTYSNTDNFKKMKNDQFAKFKKHKNDSVYFILSWIKTMQADNTKNFLFCYFGVNINSQIDELSARCIPLEEMATEPLRKLDDIFQLYTENHKIPNVIYTDFTTTAVTDTAIRINNNAH